jgi:hypothetical protein
LPTATKNIGNSRKKRLLNSRVAVTVGEPPIQEIIANIGRENICEKKKEFAKRQEKIDKKIACFYTDIVLSVRFLMLYRMFNILPVL